MEIHISERLTDTRKQNTAFVKGVYDSEISLATYTYLPEGLALKLR
jgi:hypothetical protein